MIKRLGWRGPLWAAAGRGRAFPTAWKTRRRSPRWPVNRVRRPGRRESVRYWPERRRASWLHSGRATPPQVRFTLRRISTAVLQAALMKRLCKPIETSRSVMHRKTGVVRAQNRRRLRIPTMRLNHINSDLFAQQDPQILRACAYSPAGVVQPYHGALPQGALQLLVGGG